jgi:hypothetical protein
MTGPKSTAGNEVTSVEFGAIIGKEFFPALTI